MQRDDRIDRVTAAVTLHFLVCDGEVGLFCMVMITFEFSEAYLYFVFLQAVFACMTMLLFSKALDDIVHFMVVFMVVFSASVGAGWVLFGPDAPGAPLPHLRHAHMLPAEPRTLRPERDFRGEEGPEIRRERAEPQKTKDSLKMKVLKLEERLLRKMLDTKNGRILDDVMDGFDVRDNDIQIGELIDGGRPRAGEMRCPGVRVGSWMFGGDGRVLRLAVPLCFSAFVARCGSASAALQSPSHLSNI